MDTQHDTLVAAKQAEEAPGWVGQAASSRPTIQVRNRDLHWKADAAWAALAAANDPQYPNVLVRGANLVHVTGGDGEPVGLKPYTKATLRDRMSQTAAYVEISQNGGQRIVSPPAEVAEYCSSASRRPTLTRRVLRAS